MQRFDGWDRCFKWRAIKNMDWMHLYSDVTLRPVVGLLRTGPFRVSTVVWSSWMKLLGFFLLFSGWVLVVAALVMLGQAAPRMIFLLAGLGVEIIGLVLVARSHLILRGGE
jgi:hypothetical protein